MSIPMSERALATVESIDALIPIENADSIEIARIRGWDVIVRKGDFVEGDTVVYFEIDSFLPLSDERFAFLAPRGCRKNPEGVEGHVLKTAKMRGKYSQGLALPLSDFPEIGVWSYGADVTDYIKGLEKWEPPIPNELAGSAKGAFPSVFRKTDEERIQNIAWVFDDDSGPDGWVATEKIDGSSMTVYLLNDEVGVTSRNWDLEETSFNTQWKLAHALGLIERLQGMKHLPEVALQGEIFGPGIQGNPLQVKEHSFRLFTIQVNREELPRVLWPDWATELAVPIHPLPYPQSIEEALEQVENLPSLINPQRPVEGVVWRNTHSSKFSNGARASWKAISQRYLLKHDR